MPDARPAIPAESIDRTITLIGMMGAGKTTVGRRLAAALALPFHDADIEIERAAGMPVGELFEQHGEESFRRGEAQVIERLLSGPPIVLATGGGAVTHPDTRRLIKDRTLSIWLRADVDTLVKRATRRPTRPLLKTGDPRAVISRLLDERARFYAAAVIVIDSRPGPHINTVKAILSAMKERLTKGEAPR